MGPAKENPRRTEDADHAKTNPELVDEITELVGYNRDHKDGRTRGDTLRAVAQHIATQKAKLRQQEE